MDIISKRVPPKQWANYSSASTAMWLFKTSDTRMATYLRKSAYINDRRLAQSKFCDNLLRKVGRQTIRNRLNHLNSVDFDWI